MYIFYSIEFILGSVRKLENSTTYLFNQIHYHWLENISRSKLPPVFEVPQRKAYFFKICILHLRNIFDIKSSRSNISGHQYSSVSLFEVFQGLLSVTLLPAMKILFFNTFLYVRIQSIYKYNVFCYNCAIANTSKLVFVSPKQSKTLTPDAYLSPWIHWQLIILRDRSLDKSSALKIQVFS